jgi:hypothetical protein
MPKRNLRIDAGRPACRKVSSDRNHRNHYGGGPGKGGRVLRRHEGKPENLTGAISSP